jgi:hypothetical protein
MSEGWHVTAKNITNWTENNSRRAQDTLPLLVRKLVLASTNSSAIRFPAGDNIAHRGWDGILDTTQSNAFVPCGHSVWELSTEKDVERKADEDYSKRSAETESADKKRATFVFVTSRTWPKSSWVKEKSSQSEWAQIKVLDAVDLETWLGRCPAVHRWFARLIGKRPDGALDMEQAWGSWSSATKLQCNTDLVLSGRQDEAEKLQKLLNAEPANISVAAESKEEAYAFVIAALMSNPILSPRVLVFNEEREWDVPADSQQSLILIPRFGKPSGLGLAVKNGHWVIIPCSSMQMSQPPSVALSKMANDQQIAALTKMGLNKETADDVVQYSRGYLSIIRRHRALLPIDLQTPDWAAPETAGQITAALLAGSWQADNKADCERLVYLAGVSYDAFEQNLHKWAIADDPPVRRVGNKWQIVSRQDAWLFLSPYVDAGILERFGKVVLEVLGELDPSFGSLPDERWFASALGKVTKHSDSLRRGVAEMLAILGSYGDRDCENIGSISVQDQMSVLVNQITIENMSEQRWYSLAAELPFIAEAAPEMFRKAVDLGLQGKTPPIMSLFKEESDMGGCPHSGLLWALESISWDLDYLAYVVRILAKLARLDPGGRYLNRPFNTLKGIFRGWYPQTKATLDNRLEIIYSLISSEPEVGWKLLLDLLPKGPGELATPIHKPYFRDWAKGWEKTVTREDYAKHVSAIARRSLRYALEGPHTRWLDLTKEVSKLPKAILEETLVQLRTKAATFPKPIAGEICKELRRLIAHNREFSDASWALPKTYIDQLDEIYKNLLPADLVEKHDFLFDNSDPDLTNIGSGLNYEQKSEMIEHARLTALEKIWTDLSIPGIERLATYAKTPRILGNSLADSSFGGKIEAVLLSWLESQESSLVQTAMGYVGAKYRQKQEWLGAVHSEYGKSWSDRTWANFCLSLPFSKDLFMLLNTLDQKVQKEYWEKVPIYSLQAKDAKFANHVIEQLLINNRPFAAIEAASMHLHSISAEAPLSTGLLAKALEIAAIRPSDQATAKSSTGYHISSILKKLQQTHDIDKNRLARIEWIYLPIFRHGDIKPLNLMSEALTNPIFFAEIVCILYKANPPIEGEFAALSPELEQQLAENAWRFLELIDRLPGQTESGEIDTLQLQEWVQLARAECKKKNRGAIGDESIGTLLSRSPLGKDDIWPHEAVRAIIERCESDDLERGIEVGLHNKRGVTFHAFGEGGRQERDTAESYQKQADRIKYTFPRTALMLIRIADGYKRDARMWEQREKLE